MSGDEDELDELSRREALLGGAALTTAAGAYLWGALEIYKGLRSYGGDQDDREVVVYKDDETYDDDSEQVTYTTEPDHDPVDSWNEALPGECELSTDERHWLASRLDAYDELEVDNFFDYVGNEVRLEARGDELRMEVDPDYSGDFGAETEYVVEKGYNIEDAC